MNDRGVAVRRGCAWDAGRWESRIGIPGSRHIYLGLFGNEETAARNYDRSLVRLRGPGAATNFGLADYRSDLADYHRMQQMVLRADKDWAKKMVGSTDFEEWIKTGEGTISWDTRDNCHRSY
ncbi:hypothetical protein WJX84_011506 [Apatococcus fuscideae]|uniref:AP2/ERF domain-containing protein n=1 Tax=Apatococcus fuscideae TaxID=2026836 RepID=A0AAW1SKY2_9CHLO